MFVILFNKCFEYMNLNKGFYFLVGIGSGKRAESPHHKTPIEYWLDTFRKTGGGMFQFYIKFMYLLHACLIHFQQCLPIKIPQV